MRLRGSVGARDVSFRGLRLDSGEVLEADIVGTATGLQTQVLGGIDVDVDGAPVDFAGTLMYRGAMLQDVPNLAMSLGYTHTSWTLKCELIARDVTRVLSHMRARGYTRRAPGALGTPEAVPLIVLESGYILVDQWVRRLGPVEDGTLDFG
jgi:cation diffusion facilitator CzcD-associated flavoprotein CzcO